MKLKLVLFTFTLFGSTLFAGTEEGCPFFGQMLQKSLALDDVQCQRITTINQESLPALQPLNDRLEIVTNQINFLSWTEEIPADEVALKMVDAIRERRQILIEIRKVEAEKNRKILGVLNQKQRMFIDQLVALAPTVRLFNEATAAGLITADIAYPVGSSVKGSSNRVRP